MNTGWLLQSVNCGRRRRLSYGWIVRETPERQVHSVVVEAVGVVGVGQAIGQPVGDARGRTWIRESSQQVRRSDAPSGLLAQTRTVAGEGGRGGAARDVCGTAVASRGRIGTNGVLSVEVEAAAIDGCTLTSRHDALKHGEAEGVAVAWPSGCASGEPGVARVAHWIAAGVCCQDRSYRESGGSCATR